MQIEIINPIENSLWLEFIQSFPCTTIFYHPEWLRIIHRQYDYPVFAVCSCDDNGDIKAGIPFFKIKNFLSKIKWISLPFTDYCEPLFKSNEHLENILQYLLRAYKKKIVDYLEIRSDLNIHSNFRINNGYFGHLLDVVNNETTILKSFHRQRIQGINKAIKEGLEAIVCNDPEAVEKFYILHLITRRNKGIPVQPKKFFDELYNNAICKNLGFIILINYRNTPIAGGLFLHYNKTLIYKYNASNPEYQNLRPNNLIIWQAVKESIKRGLEKIDFGRTESINKGLREFKNGFGTKEFQMNYSFYPEPASSSSISFLKKVIYPIIQHSPNFVCRAVGQFAYKYFP